LVELKKYSAERCISVLYAFNQENASPALGLTINEPSNSLDYAYMIAKNGKVRSISL
jgi:hypothetical protein